MPISENVRRHESGHAIAAVALGIELLTPAMTLLSDLEASVNVAPPTSSSPDEAWCIRRAAVKLAGPIAMIRSRGQIMDWQTLREEFEYATDLNEAERVLQKFWLDRGVCPPEHLVSEQLNRAASLAIQCIDQNEARLPPSSKRRSHRTYLASSRFSMQLPNISRSTPPTRWNKRSWLAGCI